jgi:mycothiol maleylpyruvate isomerase-like protein
LTLERGPEHVQALLDDLIAARKAFMDALADVDPALLTAPGLVGQWSARELVAHLAYWTGHAAEAVHHAEQGRLEAFGEDELDVDARNEIVARVARETDLATVRQREEAAFDALVSRMKGADPDWLEDRVSYGDTLEYVLRDDGADHYREHTADVRSWFGGADEPDADDGADDGEPEAGDGAAS